MGLARSEEGEPKCDEGDFADLRLAAAAGVRGGEAGCGDTGTDPDAAVNGAGDMGVGSGAGGCGHSCETADASMGSEGSPLAAGRAPMAAAAVALFMMAPGECDAEALRTAEGDVLKPCVFVCEADVPTIACCDSPEAADTGLSTMMGSKEVAGAGILALKSRWSDRIGCFKVDRFRDAFSSV